MPTCRQIGSPPPTNGALEAPAGAPGTRPAPADGTAGRRFAQLLRRPPREPEEPAPAGTPSGVASDPARSARLWSATAREAPAAPGPGPSAAATSLTDVRAAAGPEGAALQFTIDDGFLAGAHMAFLLRGDVLELTVEASGGEALARVRAREDELRATLTARGLELERFETGSGGRDDAEADAEEARTAAAGRRARGRGGSQGVRTG